MQQTQTVRDQNTDRSENPKTPPVPETTRNNPENVSETLPAEAEKAKLAKVVTFTVPAGENYVLHTIATDKEGKRSQSKQEALEPNTTATSINLIGTLRRDTGGGKGASNFKLQVDADAVGTVLLSMEPKREKGHVYEVPTRAYVIELGAPPKESQRAIEITKLNAETAVAAEKTAEGEVSIICCSAHWCGPCGQQLPRTLTAVGQSEGKIKVGYIDADDDASAAFREKYEITGIPVTLIFRNGNPEPIKFSELTSVAAIRDGIAGIAPEPKPKK